MWLETVHYVTRHRLASEATEGEHSSTMPAATCLQLGFNPMRLIELMYYYTASNYWEQGF